MTRTDTARLIAAILLALIGYHASANDLNLSRLMQMLAQNKTGSASFVEKKYIAVLDQAIVSSGELSYTAPDRLEKRTLEPVTESMLLEGDTLTIDRKGKQTVTLSLQAHPEMSAFVESIRGTLTGNQAALESCYTLELTGTDTAWQLILIPRQADMSRVLSRIKIAGKKAEVTRIDFEQPGGDHSEMRIRASAQP